MVTKAYIWAYRYYVLQPYIVDNADICDTRIDFGREGLIIDDLGFFRFYNRIYIESYTSFKSSIGPRWETRQRTR